MKGGHRIFYILHRTSVWTLTSPCVGSMPFWFTRDIDVHVMYAMVHITGNHRTLHSVQHGFPNWVSYSSNAGPYINVSRVLRNGNLDQPPIYALISPPLRGYKLTKP